MAEAIKVTSDAALRWSLRAAGATFNRSPQTIRKVLTQAGEKPDADGLYSTAQIVKALFSDGKAERLRKTVAETDLLEIKASILRGEYLEKAALMDVWLSVVEAIKQVIDQSELTSERKTEILQNLAGIKPGIARVQKQQTRVDEGEDDSTGN